ncbi:MAG: hypothetical protein WKF43_07420 [Acidimicrobiales bacterium]
MKSRPPAAKRVAIAVAARSRSASRATRVVLRSSELVAAFASADRARSPSRVSESRSSPSMKG